MQGLDEAAQYQRADTPDREEIFAAVDAFVEAGAPEDGAPEYPETGPPHVAHGMATELTVTG